MTSDKKSFNESQPGAGIPKAVVRKKGGISLIWFTPVVALVLAGLLFYRTETSRGPKVEVYFQNGQGLVPGHTKVEYHGIQAGIVETLRVAPDLKYVIADIRLAPQAGIAAREGAQYWVTRPEATLTQVSNLGTLLSGVYIEVMPGDGKPQYKFMGLNSEPENYARTPGLDVILEADKAGSIKEGGPVYYREVPVGKVGPHTLTNDSRKIHILVHIDDQYAPLVRDNSEFWDASGIHVDLGLTGIHVSTESLQSILGGGIAFATPDKPGEPVSDGATFALHDKGEEKWLSWSPAIELYTKK